uniref:ATP-grasp domain-containing protein n=1 Tax=Paramoeba aestuarina TaxID=180227 RepID=A0A7S4NP70_9EUKA|mmetsp:Transcript_21876/g.34014  ORF Transcript_21876/g.34014 Transcript_21876/m.34014 type:complete len:294 (+) Transcript_21876:69-950(+)
MAEFPKRVFFQPGFMPEIQAELTSRGVAVQELKTQPILGRGPAQKELESLGLSENDMVMGIPWFVDTALRVMGIPVPSPPDYPECLTHLLHRKIWDSTLGQVEADLAAGKHKNIFIKPAEGAKGFSGLCVKGPVDDQLSGEWGLLNPEIYSLVAENGGRKMPVHCSEVLDMNSEYAVYVVDGVIRKICHYMCKKSSCRCKDGEPAARGEPVLSLDMAVVEDAVRLLTKSKETEKLTGYRVDFVLSRKPGEEDYQTTLCEVNDGYVSGRYDDFPPKDFTDMSISRFASLQSTRK